MTGLNSGMSMTIVKYTHAVSLLEFGTFKCYDIYDGLPSHAFYSFVDKPVGETQVTFGRLGDNDLIDKRVCTLSNRSPRQEYIVW